MGLDSYLEIFTTMYGWYFSSVIVQTLLDTGLVALPFVFMLIKAWMEAHEEGAERGGVQMMIRKLEIQIWTSLFVYVMCVVSSSVTSLSGVSLYYAPTRTTVNPNPQPGTMSNNESSYSQVFGAGAPSNVSVPAWWYTVMGLSSGFNAAVRAGINRGVSDLRVIEDTARSATITDPFLRNEVKRFRDECFTPARSRLLRSEAQTPEVAQAITAKGEADLDWMGGVAYRTDPSLYADLYASGDVPGFAYADFPDESLPPGHPIPQWGRPTCKQWWETSDTGLRAKLVTQAGTANGLKAKITSVFTTSSADEIDDQLAKLAINNGASNYVDTQRMFGDDRSTAQKVANAIPEAVGAGGSVLMAFLSTASLMPLINMISMAQPMILMAIYMFLPLATILSGYNLQVLVLGGLGIFTVKFWPTLWYITRWLDDNMIKAMYPDSSTLLSVLTLDADGGYKRMMLNTLMTLMYLGLPAIWTVVMTWAGQNLGSHVSGLIDDAAKVANRSGAVGAKSSSNFAGRLSQGSKSKK
jgi:hypothetical protein